MSLSSELPPMLYTRLGKTGTKVSKICLGTMSYGDPNWKQWVLNEEQSIPLIRKAYEMGINFFDSANVYSFGKSEEVLGNALEGFVSRDDVVIATKVYFSMDNKPNSRGLSRKHIMSSVEASLKRLKTDYIDLYQIHMWDNETPIEETLDTLHDLVRSGKVRYIGASNTFAWQLGKALHTSKYNGITSFATMQNHYNLIYREDEREVHPLCLSEGIGLLPWSPLARGYLAGARTKENHKEVTTRAKSDPIANWLYCKGYSADNDWEIIDRVKELAKKKNVSAAQISLAWLLHKPIVTAPVIGASKVSHLEDAIKAVHLKLSNEEMKYLEESYQAHPIPGQ